MTIGGMLNDLHFSEESGDELKVGDQLLRGQYCIERFLNSGGFGVTYLARDSLERRVVIKECFPASMCRRHRNVVRARSQSHEREFKAVVRLFRNEALRLSKLRHPNIVGVHQVFEDNGTAYMALDFIQGRDLLDLIEQDGQKLAPGDIKRLLLQILDAVAYIHDHAILHRDISPDNILLDTSGTPILIDFGAAREEATRKSRALSALHVVKDGYSPQEFYIAGSTQTASSDLYSLAATFYHLITGKAVPNSQARLSAIAANEPEPFQPLSPRTEGYDEHFLDALNQALAVFPKDRLQSAREWISRIDADKRKRHLLARADRDKLIENSIRKLTRETNAAIRSQAAEEAFEAAEKVLRSSESNDAANIPVALEPDDFSEFSNLQEPLDDPDAEVCQEPPDDPDTEECQDPFEAFLSGLPEYVDEVDLVIPAAPKKPELPPRRRSILNWVFSVPLVLLAGRSQSQPPENERSGR